MSEYPPGQHPVELAIELLFTKLEDGCTALSDATPTELTMLLEAASRAYLDYGGTGKDSFDVAMRDYRRPGEVLSIAIRRTYGDFGSARYRETEREMETLRAQIGAAR